MAQFLILDLDSERFKIVDGWDEIEKRVRDHLDQNIVVLPAATMTTRKVAIDALKTFIVSGGRVPGTPEPSMTP